MIVPSMTGQVAAASAALPWFAATIALGLGWWLAGRLVPSALTIRARTFRQNSARSVQRAPGWGAVDRLVVWLGAKAALETRRSAENRVRQAGWSGPEAASRLIVASWLLPLLLPLFVLLALLPGLAAPSGRNILILAALAAAGRFGPGLYVANIAARRLQAIALGLPDAIDLLVICAEAGLNLELALARTGRELAPAQPDIAGELLLTATELGLLPYRADSFGNLARRVPLPQIQALADMLVQTERFGTPLTHALRLLAAEYRTGRLLSAEEAAAKLPALMTVPMIAFILPPLFIVLIGPAIINAMAS
ncbi:MAG: type II secretion system F family protein [Sandarakinorhabdus sp.]|nr:type II secretion system F family protein [Sandarakinorhabdus sp.]